jgi:hypothetical protein
MYTNQSGGDFAAGEYMNNPTQADLTAPEDNASATTPHAGGATAQSGGAVAPVSTTFPQEITVRVDLRIRVNSQDERDSYLIPGTHNPQIGFIADVFDSFQSYNVEELLNVNGLPYDEVRRQLAEAQKF